MRSMKLGLVGAVGLLVSTACAGNDREHLAQSRQAICGDNVCDVGENMTCPADCAINPEPCGDGTCDAATESQITCPKDCGGAWFPIGPAPLDQTVTNAGGSHPVPGVSASGRATIVAVNPQNSADVWLGTAGGGVWHSSTMGIFLPGTDGTPKLIDPSWRPMTDDQKSLAIGAVKLADCNATRCNTIWIGTGEDNIRRQTYYGYGLIKGEWVDPGGENAPDAAYVFTAFAAENFRFGSVQDIQIVADGSLYVAVSSGLTATEAGTSRLAKVPPDGYGLHHCLPDGTDDPATPEDERCTPVMTLTTPDGDTGLPGDLELANGRLFMTVNHLGILRSQPNAYNQWCYLNPGPTQDPSCPGINPQTTSGLPNSTSAPFDHVEIAFSTDGQTAYATFATSADRTQSSTSPLIYSSSNGGDTWTQVIASGGGSTPAKAPAAYSRYTHGLTVHPDAAATVYSGGVFGLGVSVNGSASFGDKSSGGLHGDVQDVVVVSKNARVTQRGGAQAACAGQMACNNCLTTTPPPADCATDVLCLRDDSAKPATGCPNMAKDLIYVASDGGLAFAESDPDVGTISSVGWQSANDNLVTAQLFGLGAAVIMQPSPPPMGAIAGTAVFAGMQDSASIQFTGTSLWKLLDDADGGDASVLTDGHIVTTIFDQYQLGHGGVLDGFRSDLPLVGGTLPDLSPASSFYQPHVLVGGSSVSGGLYFATDRVVTGTAFGIGSTVMSPVFTDLTMPAPTVPPELEKKSSIITALAVSEGAAPRAWVGLYDGRVYVSRPTGGLPSTDINQWDQVATAAMPKVTVSQIHLSPTDDKHAWVSFAGFEDGSMAWELQLADGGNTATPLTGLPPNDPVQFVRPDPTDPATLWAGTDHGLFARLGGATDFQKLEYEATGIPNVPVFDMDFDLTGNRQFIATHGRGVWMRTSKPQVTSDEGWVKDDIWDIPVSGTGFSCPSGNCACQMQILLQDGTPCAGPSGLDADFHPGAIKLSRVASDPSGTKYELSTSADGWWNGKKVAWACRSGGCLPNAMGTRTDIGLCRLDPTNRMAAVQVQCDGNDAVLVPIRGAPQLARPPSNVLEITNDATPQPRIVSRSDAEAATAHGGKSAAVPAAAGTKGSRKSGGTQPEQALTNQANAGLAFTIIPTMTASSANGGDRALCGAHVELAGGETADAIEQILADAINSSAECVAVGVTANANPAARHHPDAEDSYPPTSALRVNPPPGMVGTELIIAVRAEPGEGTGLCFTLDDLGNPTLNQLSIIEAEFLASASGAAGGHLTVTERSKIGVCSHEITTTAGETPVDVAAAVEAAFQNNAGVDGPGSCPSVQNPRDIERAGAPDSVVSVLANRVTICLHDAGLGLRVGPEGVAVAPPVALCHDPVVLTADATCHASLTRADLDAGSFDPDGPAPDCTLSSTGPFGKTGGTVTLTCVDSTGLSDQCTAQVTLTDTSPPAITCPVSVNVPCTNANGATASFSATATDNCGVQGTPQCTPISGSVFALGTRVDTCTVSDTAGNSATCSFNVTVALGDNPICCPSGTNIILGTSNNDVLNGTSSRDCIFGRGAQDTINGNGGNDIISGGDGDDIISGGLGDDLIFGGTGQDHINGDAGNDVISGGDGDDICHGNDGNDTVLGAQGQDQLFGDAGTDTLIGETGDDHLEGGDGNDLLIGGGLHDVCLGGAGTDTFQTCQTQTQ
jgi:hypothetical protein